MSTAVRDWTPPGFADRPVLKGPIDEVLAAWSAAWLAGMRLGVVRWDPAGEGAQPEPRPEDRSVRRSLSVTAPSRALTRLLERALDAEIPSGAATEADRQVLDALARRLLDDLLTRLEAALLDSGQAIVARRSAQLGAERVRIGVGEPDGGVLIWLEAPAQVVAAAVRAAMPPPRPRPPPVGFVRAISDQPVRLEAVLGHVRLGLAELRGLSVGDVLVLDRRLAEPAQLRLAGAGPLAQANLIEVEGKMALDLQPDPS